MTNERSERDELLSYISDAHKDAYGTRPSLDRFRDLTVDELRVEAGKLSDAVAESIDEDRQREAAAIVVFEAEVGKLMSSEGVSWNDAALKHIQNKDAYYYGDWGYSEYCLGLSYNYLTQRLPKVNAYGNWAKTNLGETE